MRLIGLSPSQAASPLAIEPYSLRHAAVFTWLAAGMPAAEVAERAGHSVAMLLNIYAKVLDEQRETSNKRIDEVLGDQEQEALRR